jgi:hypothetical protein
MTGVKASRLYRDGGNCVQPFLLIGHINPFDDEAVGMTPFVANAHRPINNIDMNYHSRAMYFGCAGGVHCLRSVCLLIVEDSLCAPLEGGNALVKESES